MKKQIIFLFTVLLSLITVSSQAQQPVSPPLPSQQSPAEFPSSSPSANTNLTYKIINAPNHTFGYNVLADDRLMIHQTSIPAMPGNDGFKTKEDASKVAELVIEKIRKGEMPPTIGIDAIKELKVIDELIQSQLTLNA